MKLSAWARRQGVHYNTALRWVRDNKMPVPFARTATGTIIVKEFPEESGNPFDRAALYARVSSSGQKSDLEAQLGRLSLFAARNNLRVVASSGETGSGFNGHRPKLMKLLADASIKTIVVEHRDRLMRFGFERRSAKNKAQKALKAIQE